MTGTLAMLIPILALSIPIVAINSGAYAKTHSGEDQTRIWRRESFNLKI